MQHFIATRRLSAAAFGEEEPSETALALAPWLKRTCQP